MPEQIVAGSNEQIETELNQEANPKEQASVTAPSASSTPKVEVPEDPEIDLGVDPTGKPLKFKKSQILEFHKGSMLQSDYTKKTQELSAQKEELKEMSNIIEHLKTNPKKAERIIAILDEKEEATEQKIDEIDEALKGIDENDPYAKTLRMLKAQNQMILKQNQSLQNKVEKFEQKTQSMEQAEAVKQAENKLNEALEKISKSLKFDDDDDKADWRKMVLTYLVNNPRKYTDETEFLADVEQVSKMEHVALVKRNERITGRYIKAKGSGNAEIPTHPAGSGGAPLSKKPTMENLDETLIEALQNEEKNPT